MTTGTIDYAKIYFKFPTPTPIRGEPTHTDIRQLKKEIRANAASVDCDLGGGDHGYLGLVLTSQEYQKIAQTAFTAPSYPSALAIPSGTDPVVALNLRTKHSEAKDAHRKCKEVERALLRHVQNAIDEEWLDSLINEDTQLIEEDIVDVLQYLDENYGEVPSEELKEMENATIATAYNPADSMLMVFQPIERLRKFAIQAKRPYTEPQLLDFALTIIRNTRDFEKAQEEWGELKEDQKTWKKFKEHFRGWRKKLRSIRGPSMQQAGLLHANMLAEQVKQAMESQRNDVANMMREVLHESGIATDENVPPRENRANAVIDDPVQLELMKVLREIKSELQSVRNATRDSDAGGSTNTRGRRRNRTKKQQPAIPADGICLRCPDNLAQQQGYHRTYTKKYCWTHGAWNHDSKDCGTPAAGHKNDATFTNKMGGSKAFCDS